MNYSPAGLNCVVAANAQYDGPYDYGMGWGQVGGKGCSITTKRLIVLSTMNLHLVDQ